MEIKPFRAYRFTSEVVGDTGDCVAPPYDVIDDGQRDRLYAKNDHNIVRIIRPKKSADGDKDVYAAAADFLNSWIDSGALTQDKKETIYAYVQDFELAGAWFQRYSFVALGKLEPFGKTVKAHENTLIGPRQDRLNLKRAADADFGLVFMLYDDSQHTADKIIEAKVNSNALLELTDEQNVRHRLFALTDQAEIASISEMMNDKSCIIADGHHRYETGLAYAAESDNPAAQYQMLAFANTYHKGLIVLATHRFVRGVDNFDFKAFIEKLGGDFKINRLSFGSAESARTARHAMLANMKTAHARDVNCFGIYGGDGAFYVAVLKDTASMDEIAADMSVAWRRLDVTVLSKLVLDNILGIDADKLACGDYVQYIKDSGNKAKELVRQIDAGLGQVVFFMNPPKIKEIRMVADAGERMPQKSTYFYPKIFTGMTVHKLILQRDLAL